MSSSTSLERLDPPRAPGWVERFADPSDRMLAVLLLAPAAILLGLIVVYPIGKLMFNSFFDIRLSGGGADVAPFVGLENYIQVLKDNVFWEAFWNTVLITLITVFGSLVVGLGLALLANLPFRVKWPVRLSLLLPWGLPLAFTGLIFAWFFHTEYGVVNDLLSRLGLEPRQWLLQPGTAFAAICLAIIWKASSFMGLILLAGLQMIPRSLYEAAEVDGATKWQQFCQVTLPLLVPSIVVALIFRTITALQTFDIPYTMTKGGPGHATQTLAMYIQTNTLEYGDIGYGSTLAVFMFLLSMVVTAFYLRRIHQD